MMQAKFIDGEKLLELHFSKVWVIYTSDPTA